MEEISKLEQAVDKLAEEKKKYSIKGILSDWVDEIISEFETAPELIDAVLDPKKTAAGFIARTAEYGFAHKTVVDKQILNMCPEIKKVIGNHEFSIGIPSRPQRKKLIKEYYLGGKK